MHIENSCSVLNTICCYFVIYIVASLLSEYTKIEKPVTSGLNMTVIIVAAAVIVLILIFSIITVTSVLACRKPTVVVRRRDRRSSKPPDEFDLSEAGFGEGFHRRSDLYRASMYGECEDRIQRILEGNHFNFIYNTYTY